MKIADLRKVMLKNGWIERRYPSGKGLMTIYERKKMPYSSQISEWQLLKILKEVKEVDEK